MTQQRRPGFPARLQAQPAAVPARPAGAGLRPPAQAPLAPQGLGLDSAAVRARMVQRLAASGIQSLAVLAAMGAVERHRFVDSALVNQAYEDTSLPIGLGQTISKPSVVARMVELLLGAEALRSGSGPGRVLEIGTGCGYQAAVLARLAREVYTVERLRALHEKARDNLRPLRLANVHLLLGDGMLGYAKGAPYAAIVSAAGGELLPQHWCDQLAVGGRLVAPTVGNNGQQVLLVVDKTAHGLQQSVLEAVHFVPLKSGIA
ncbi:protein-L-isoaspartate(D-aspartate) O-methyltransferase [Acidovorax sp. FG27]|uniref:protein-L-isoaspartate(D-aspartate) O-methyltransferase n=1 Tax=Acidovorax sp. FG27 TaxID=3133652 RepID=UPI0030E98A1D